jgi:hypothetical protein
MQMKGETRTHYLNLILIQSITDFYFLYIKTQEFLDITITL